MCRGIHGIDHAAGDIGAAVRNYGQGILYRVRHRIKFVYVFPRTEPERADDRGVGIFRQYRNSKVSAIRYAFVGIIVLVDAHHHGCGGRCDLRGAVRRAAGGPPVIPGGNDIHAVRHGVKCFLIHKKLLYSRVFRSRQHGGKCGK